MISRMENFAVAGLKAEAPFPLIGSHVGDYSFCIDELVAPEGAFLF